ncbi:MAG: S8 family serine peptidase [Acidobacteria bacterium]|nr:S8 family serine peptidase [Acidobacteriota bacterium]
MGPRSSLFTALALSLVTIGLFAQEASQRGEPEARALDPTPSADERYIIAFRKFGPDAAAAIHGAGGRVALQLPDRAALAAYLPRTALAGLARNPNVRYIEPDARRYPLSQSTPYGINMVQADLLSDANAGGMKVCMIDSGLYVNHEDLTASGVTGDSDPGGAGDWFEDGFGHGTHTAGTIVALNNDKGVLGILPNGHLQMHIVRVFGNSGAWTYSSTLVNALGKCQTAGANVVSMSLGGAYPNLTEELAFNDAYSAGVLSVAAAGNAGTNAYSYPASYNSVIAVGAIDSNKVVAGFSQKNDQVELAAPGVGVLSTVPYLEHNTLSVDSQTYQANWIQNAARSTSGVTGILASGGLCTATNTGWNGKVVMCERGSISFFDKVKNVQISGGLAAVIYNNVPGNFIGTLGNGNSSTIPAISLSQADGQFVVANKIGLSGTVVSWVEKPASGYEPWDGTSMATPHVSGVAALVWSHFPNCTNVNIRQAMDATAQDLGAAGRDTSYGYGLVQAKAAYDYLQTNGCDSGGGGGGGTGTAPVISNVYSVKVNKGGAFAIRWTTDIPATSHVLFTCCGLFSNYTLVTQHDMGFRGRKGTLYEYWVFSEESPGGEASMSGPHYHQN